MPLQPADLKQFQPGDALTVTVERFGNKYLGETSLGGKTVLVPAALPGETIRGEVLRNWERRLLLHPVEVLDPSPDRVEPQCRHFGTCAGCQFQHLAYERQLELKRSRLEAYFEGDEAVSPLPLRGVIGSPQPYGYRNNIKLHGPGEPGFWRVLGIDMVRNEHCPVCLPQVEAALQQQRQQGFGAWRDRGIDNVLIRGTSQGEVYVGPEQPGEGEVAWLSEELAHPLTGETYELAVPAHAFWQGSTPMIPYLVEQAIRPVQAFEPETLVEAYCGMGLFGLMGAPFARSVVGLEDNPLAVAAARYNRDAQGLAHYQIWQGQAERQLGNLLEGFPLARTSALVDPPRSGLPKKALKQLLRHPPQQLVYVSCNPESFARNVRQLCRQTYRLQDLVGLDLFPQTKHLECVGVLERTA